MRKIVLLILLLSSTLSYAQEIPISKETGKVEYTEVVEAPGSKDELYSRAKKWTASTFKSAHEVIQAEDKDEGYLIIKGLTDANTLVYFNKIPVSQNAVMDFTIGLDFKDNRYRYRVFDISFTTIGTPMDTTTPIEDTIIDEEADATAMREEYHQAKVSKKNTEETIKVRFSLFEQYRNTATSTIEGLIRSLKIDMDPGHKSDSW